MGEIATMHQNIAERQLQLPKLVMRVRHHHQPFACLGGTVGRRKGQDRDLDHRARWIGDPRGFVGSKRVRWWWETKETKALIVSLTAGVLDQVPASFRTLAIDIAEQSRVLCTEVVHIGSVCDERKQEGVREWPGLSSLDRYQGGEGAGTAVSYPHEHAWSNDSQRKVGRTWYVVRAAYRRGEERERERDRQTDRQTDGQRQTDRDRE